MQHRVRALRIQRPALVFGVACHVAAARVLDLWTTRIVTPNLAGEQNLALAALGGSWFSLVLLSLLVTLFVAAFFAAAIAVQPRVLPRRPGLSYEAFLRCMIWGRPRPLRELFWRWPPRRRWLWAVGRFLPWAVVATSLMASVGNLAAYAWPAARPWWALMVGNLLSQAVLLLGAIGASAVPWTRFEHARYVAAQRARSTAAGTAGAGS